MAYYAKSASEMYEQEFGLLKIQETPFVSDSVLTTEGYETQGHLAGKAASLLMKFLWLARLSRPDLSYAIVSLAGSIARWSRNNDVQLKRLLGYVKGTYSLGLWGVVQHTAIPPTLKVYCDADLAGDPVTCKSHSGIYVVTEFEDGSVFPLSWTSKRVVRSTTEAELASANEGIFQDAIPIKALLEAIQEVEVPTFPMEDNTSCIAIIQAGYSPKLRSMPRTHRISVAALSEALETNLIQIRHVESKLQLGDLLTKALNRQVFLDLRHRLGIGQRTKEPCAKATATHATN